MPQSLSLVLIHVVFSTKDRRPVLNPSLRPALHAYLAGVSRTAGCECYRVGGTADHVHLALDLARTRTVAGLVETLKVSSSKWLKQEAGLADFAWQRGYGAFSVRASERERLCRYIERQDEHHRIRTFEEEYRELLARHEVAFDERFVWG